MIPVRIDAEAMLNDINAWGWRDQKLETALNYSPGYVAKLRAGLKGATFRDRQYVHMAALLNLWESERERFAPTQTLVSAST